MNEGIAFLSLLWNIFLFILGICVVVAVLNTGKYARQIFNLLLAHTTHTHPMLCRACLDRAKFNTLEPATDKKGNPILKCPSCKGTRRLN